MKLNDQEKQNLWEKKTITKNIEQIFVTQTENDEQVWPDAGVRGWIGIRVESLGSGSLRVELVKSEDARRGVGRFVVCDPEGVRLGHEKTIYIKGNVFDQDRGMALLADKDAPAKIELGGACNIWEKKKVVECNLKVTDGSRLKIFNELGR